MNNANYDIQCNQCAKFLLKTNNSRTHKNPCFVNFFFALNIKKCSTRYYIQRI